MKMNWSALKLTPAMQGIIQAALTLLLGAVVAGANAGIQYLAQGGAINWGELWLFIWGALAASLTAGGLAYAKAHITQIMQAAQDLLGEVQAVATNAPAPQPAQASPLVVIHAAQPQLTQAQFNAQLTAIAQAQRAAGVVQVEQAPASPGPQEIKAAVNPEDTLPYSAVQRV